MPWTLLLGEVRQPSGCGAVTIDRMTTALASVARETDLLSRALEAVLDRAARPRVRRARDVDPPHGGRAAGRRRERARGADGLPARARRRAGRAVHPRLLAAAAARQHRRGARADPAPARVRRVGRPASASRSRRPPELLAQEGVDAAEALRSLHVELVLTAHPTEATRRSVLDHQADLIELLDRLDDPRSGHARRRAAARGAPGDPHRSGGRPTRSGARARAWTTRCAATCSCSSRRCSTRCPRRWGRSSGRSATRVEAPVLAFGSWAGSDMDGHPEVGAETLARTLELHRRGRAAAAARRASRRLAQRYSHSERRIAVTRGAGARRWSATRASCRRPACCAARTGSGSRCGPSSASSSAGSSNMLRGVRP